MTHRALAQEGPDLHRGDISLSPVRASRWRRSRSTVVAGGEPRNDDHDLESSAEAQPRYRRNLRSRYEAPTLASRAKQAPRRTPVRWYPIHGYQHDQPSQL